MRPRGNEFGVFPKKVSGSTIYYYWVYGNNKRVFRSTGKKTRDEAVKYCRSLQIKGQLISRKELLFSSFTKDLFDYKKCPYIRRRLVRSYTYAHSWAKRQKRLLDSIIKPYFGQRYIPTISFHDIDEFIMSLKKQNFSNKKVNHVITTMKNIFNYAEMIGLIQTNPCKTFKPFKVNTPEKGILTREELQKLFSEENRGQIWPERIHYIFNYLAAHTGLRLGEILALRLIDFSNGKLNITHSFSPDSLNDGGLKSTKSGKSRVIPLDKKLGDLFKEVCQGKQHDQFIFSTSQGLRPMDHKAVYKRFYKALEAIGIDKAERKRRNITFHSYRHGVNTFFLEAGTPPETVRLILGHSGSAMTARYSHLQLPSIESLDVSSDCLKQDDSNHGTVPSYINDLIDMVLLYPDGKRVVKSLDAVALEIQKQNKQPTEKYLREMFLKPDGKQYSLRACKQAINYANFN